MKQLSSILCGVFVAALLTIVSMVSAQESPQGVTQSLTPEQRQRIQAKLPELRKEIQTLAPLQQAARVAKFFDEFEDLTPAQRQGLGQTILNQANAPPRAPSVRSNNVVDPNNPFSGSLTALTDFGTTTYQGKKGGLYPDGSNERPTAHTAEGVRIAQAIKPLDTDGNVDETNGKIVWLSIGMSNTAQATQGFFEVMRDDTEKNPKLELVNGAFGGQAINQINNPTVGYWNNIVEQRLKPLGLSPEQVQIVWYKQAEMGPTNTNFEEYTAELKTKYASVMRILKQKYPNLKLVYLSPRTYAGYAKTRLNPEPFAWYTGWTIKFLIEDQINGAADLRFKGDDAPVAWLSWGPYLWANGETPNTNGLFYLPADYGTDGTHPDNSGVKKVAKELHRFFTTDVTTVPWFVRQETKNAPPANELDKDDVALSLIYRQDGGRAEMLRGEEDTLWLKARLVIWNDGRVLFGTGPERNIDNWKYFFGKVEQKKIAEMQERVRVAFRIAKKNQEIADIGPGASSYYILRVGTKDDVTSIITWQMFKNASSFPNSVAVVAENTTDGKPILLPEFYNTWKTVKDAVVLFGENVADTKEAVPVDVVGRRNEFVIRDKTGKVLAEYPPPKQ